MNQTYIISIYSLKMNPSNTGMRLAIVRCILSVTSTAFPFAPQLPHHARSQSRASIVGAGSFKNSAFDILTSHACIHVLVPVRGPANKEPAGSRVHTHARLT